MGQVFLSLLSGLLPKSWGLDHPWVPGGGRAPLDRQALMVEDVERHTDMVWGS